MRTEEFIIYLDTRVKDVVGKIDKLDKSDDLVWDIINAMSKTISSMSERIDILVERIDRLEAK